MFSEMKVELVDHMGDDISVVNAARVSFDKMSEFVKVQKPLEAPEEILGAPSQVAGFDTELELSAADKKLISYLSRHNHWSPFSHAFLSFRIKAPIFVARQLVKHQVGLAWNEVSRRYVDSEPEFYSVPGWRPRAKNVKQGSGADTIPVTPTSVGALKSKSGLPMQLSRVQIEINHAAMCQMALGLYNDLLDQDVAPEMARMVLPQSMMTEWIWSGSLFAFARVANLRLDSHAQAETRVVAQRISDEAEKLFPVSWQELVLRNNTETGQT